MAYDGDAAGAFGEIKSRQQSQGSSVELSVAEDFTPVEILFEEASFVPRADGFSAPDDPKQSPRARG